MTSSPLDAPAPPVSGAVERIVALALAAVLVVLVLVLVDLSRGAAEAPSAPFDFENPLLFAQAGQCVEVVDSSRPELGQRLVVRAPGPVLRAFSGPATIPGLPGPVRDARTLPAYLVCETSAGGPPVPREPGAQPPRSEAYVFPMNGFGMPLEATCVLRAIRPASVHWQGQTRRAYEVQLQRYGQPEGPWVVWMAKDVPALGTMKRQYGTESAGSNAQVFLVPPDCR